MSEQEEIVEIARREMQRYLPLLERIEADPALWERMTVSLGIATLNGYRAALAALSAKGYTISKRRGIGHEQEEYVARDDASTAGALE